MPDNPASLENLHDIVLPAPAPWWPPAPGWYALGFVVLLVVVWRGAVAWLRWRRNAYRRQALAELEALESALASGESAADLLPRIPEILKRAAIAAYGRPTAAPLAGAPWIEFLDRTAGRPLFAGKIGQLLLEFSYGTPTADSEQIQAVLAAVRAWIVRHRLDEKKSDALDHAPGSRSAAP